MNIALCNRDESLWVGGDMVQLLAYRNALKKLGHDPVYISDPTPKLTGYTHRPPYDEAWLFNVNFSWTLTQARAAKEAGIPYRVFAIFYPEMLGKPGMNSFSEIREIFGEAKNVYALSESERLEIRMTMYEGYEPNNLSVIDNGVDKTIFNTEGAKEVNEREGVIFVGRMEPGKGQLKLIEACVDLDLKLTLVGQPTDRGYYDACKMAGIPLKDKLIIRGPLPQETISYELRKHRLFVLPSTSERNNLAILEAAASGCAVVDSIYNRSSSMHWWPTADPKKPDAFKMEISRIYKKPKDFMDQVKSWEEVVNDIIKS